MKTNLLKAARVRCCMTRADVASIIEKTSDAYAKKERGVILFTLAEVAKITEALNLTFEEFNDIFFDSKLQFSNK